MIPLRYLGALLQNIFNFDHLVIIWLTEVSFLVLSKICCVSVVNKNSLLNVQAKLSFKLFALAFADIKEDEKVLKPLAAAVQKSNATQAWK